MSNPNGERDYLLLSLASLLVIVVVLVEQGLGLWSAIPLVMGAIGVLIPGSISVPFVLLGILFLISLQPWIVGVWFGWDTEPAWPLVLIMAAAVLGYVAGHTRLLTIRRFAVPPDPRRELSPKAERARRRWLLPMTAAKRPGLLPSGEIVRLLVTVPVFVLFAFLIWLNVVLERHGNPIFPPILWRIVVLIWSAAIVLLLLYTVLAYLRQALASREQSLLYLQDQLWSATRGEQRRIHSWTAWVELRREKENEQK